jgi:hypothetical protein
MGDLKADTGKLRTAAGIWSDCAADTWKVHTDLLPAVGQGDKFGLLAGSSGVSENYDTWIQAMADAARTGSRNFYWLSSALVAIADTYDGTDATVAQSMDSLDRMI